MAGHTAGPQALEAEIAQLRGLDITGLRARWHSMFRRKAPEHLPRHLLFKILAYHRQAEVYGDLDRDTKAFLDRLARRPDGISKLNPDGPRPTRLRPGTVLVREWNGRAERVVVLDEGFGWNDKTYRSLSGIARAITGTRWSGPRFFGLRDSAEPSP
jgi:hypothetical protein